MAVGVWLSVCGYCCGSACDAAWLVPQADAATVCVCEHVGGKSTGRRRTNQQREQQQQQRTAGGKVSPRETLPPESVMGVAQHKTLGAAPCRARGRESTCRSATRGKSR